MPEIEDYMSGRAACAFPWKDDLRASLLEIVAKAESFDEYWLALQWQRDVFGQCQNEAERLFRDKVLARKARGRRED